MRSHEPKAIAASLTAKERKALLWCRADGSFRQRTVGRGVNYLVLQELRNLIRDEQPAPLVEQVGEDPEATFRVTPLGKEVRQVLADNGGRLLDFSLKRRSERGIV